jgi:hypothetical protein
MYALLQLIATRLMFFGARPAWPQGGAPVWPGATGGHLMSAQRYSYTECEHSSQFI